MEADTPELISMDELTLPALHVETTERVVRTPDQLVFMRQNAINKHQVPQYYWDARDRWFIAVDIKRIRKASFWMRFVGPDDLMIADFKLRLLASPPMEWAKLYRELARSVWHKDGAKIQEAKAMLRERCTSLEVTGWMDRYSTFKTKY